MSQLGDIADGVKTALNAAGFSPAFTAERVYLPLATLEGLEALQVLVVPKSRLLAKQARKISQSQDVQIDVGILKRISADPTTVAANAELDPLVALAESVMGLYGAGDSAGLGKWFATDNEILYDQDKLLQQKTFLTVVTFTFKVL